MDVLFAGTDSQNSSSKSLAMYIICFLIVSFGKLKAPMFALTTSSISIDKILPPFSKRSDNVWDELSKVQHSAGKDPS